MHLHMSVSILKGHANIYNCLSLLHTHANSINEMWIQMNYLSVNEIYTHPVLQYFDNFCLLFLFSPNFCKEIMKISCWWFCQVTVTVILPFNLFSRICMWRPVTYWYYYALPIYSLFSNINFKTRILQLNIILSFNVFCWGDSISRVSC